MTLETETRRTSRDYLATPNGPGGGPGVLLLHSGRGLTGYVKRTAQRLAHQGYVTLAVDLFDGRTPESTEEARATKDAVDHAATLRSIEDAASFLTGHESVTRREIGVVGIGYGAEWAIRLAENMTGAVRTVVVFYGITGCDWSQLDVAFQGHFAELDYDIPKQSVEQLRSQFQGTGLDWEVHLYHSVQPSFFEDEPTARYDADAAREAWERTVAFLDRTL